MPNLVSSLFSDRLMSVGVYSDPFDNVTLSLSKGKGYILRASITLRFRIALAKRSE